MRPEERQAIRQKFEACFPNEWIIDDRKAAEFVDEEVQKLFDEIERLRGVLELVDVAQGDGERSYPERVKKIAVIVRTELGKCICGIGDVASLSCPLHGLGTRQALEGDSK